MGSPAAPGAPRTARSIARTQLTAAILRSARTQLAEVGPGQLSVRAVARDLQMASSAVYRYFPSRDELLTALIVQCYNELGEVAEQAEADAARQDFRSRWVGLAHATRRWALDHPHDFALLFGSPVPGYAAPRTTIEPAARITGVVLRLVCDIQEAGAAPAPSEQGAPESPSQSVHDALAGVRGATGIALTDDLALRGLQAWSGLIGTLTLELFGHFANGITDLDTYFTAITHRLSPV